MNCKQPLGRVYNSPKYLKNEKRQDKGSSSTTRYPAVPRTLLTDELWSKLLIILLELGLYDKPNLRRTIEGILYRMRTGCPWRDLPASFRQIPSCL